MDKAQLKSILLTILFFVFMAMLIYSISTTLITPVDNFLDTDGTLDLRGSCSPTAFDGTTWWNITNATLYTDISGSWIKNKTINVTSPVGNSTYYFNFTNVRNGTAEGTFKWNIECNEENGTGLSNGLPIQKSFAGNNTIIVQYPSSTITSISPIDNFLDLDGSNANFTAIASPPADWNISSMQLFTNVSGTWKSNETYSGFSPILGSTRIGNFSNTSSIPDYSSLPDGSRIVWSIAVITKLNSGDNITNKTTFTQNRTLRVEYPPNMSLNRPTNLNWSQNRKIALNFTPASHYTSEVPFQCQSNRQPSPGRLADDWHHCAEHGHAVLSAHRHEPRQHR